MLLVPLLILVGFVLGRLTGGTGARTHALAPEVASASAPAPAPAREVASMTACTKDLSETRLKLAICAAYLSPGNPGATRSAEATQRPPALRFRGGKRLSSPITTEMIEPTDSIFVKRSDGSIRFYGPGEWPPPGGPGVGSKILNRKRADGTIELSPPDGFPEPEGPVVMPGETEEERITRLFKATTNAILVQHADGSRDVYAPDEWPPPNGPEPGARILTRRLGDGGADWFPPDDDSN